MRSLQSVFILAATSLALVLAGCEQETADQTDTTTNSESSGTGNEYSSTSDQVEEDEQLITTADGEIVATLNANDDKEIAITARVRERNVGQPVLDFANMLNEAHSRHKEATLAVARELGVAPAEGAQAQQIRAKSEEVLAELMPLDGEEFERAFIKHMVTGHSEALTTIDEALRDVTEDRLRQHLEDTRRTVADHLRQAEELQAQLGG